MDIDLAALKALERERDLSLNVIIPAIEQATLEREIEIPDLGTLSMAAWTPPVLGHAAGHCDQALDVLRDRGAIQ